MGRLLYLLAGVFFAVWASEAELLTVKFKPGKLGIGADWDVGTVTRVDKETQGHRHGIEVGMIMKSIDGKDYKEALLDKRIAGKKDYEVTFERLGGSPAPAKKPKNAGGGKPRQRFDLEIPRLTEAQLLANATLRTGHHPYVLTGFVDGKWNLNNFTLDRFLQKIPFEWVDYYERNMADLGQKPFLLKFKDALPKFQDKSSGIPRYMQLRLSLRGWKRLRKDFSPKPVPDLFWDDDEWIGKCMSKNGKPDQEAIDNFYTTKQWKFLLIGEKGTSMFFHQDGTSSSSWQAQVMGKKKWTLCPHTESRFLSNSIDTFSERDATHKTFAKAVCGQVVVNQGEMVYYPGYWWHHTLQLETPSIGYTGALVGTEINRADVGHDGRPHYAFFQDVKGDCSKCWQAGNPNRLCDDISLQWPGAAPPISRIVCDEYLPKCLELWDKHAKTLNTQPRSEL